MQIGDYFVYEGRRSAVRPRLRSSAAPCFIRCASPGNGGHHHTLELSHRHSRLEAGAGADQRQHRGHEAGQRRPLNLTQYRPDTGRGRFARRACSLVTGSGSVVGREITGNPMVKGVSFTGSDTVGCGIHGQVTSRGGKAQCEMGGKNPVIVLEDADIDKAVNLSIMGAMWSTGQKCTATSRVIVHKDVVEEFTAIEPGYRRHPDRQRA